MMKINMNKMLQYEYEYEQELSKNGAATVLQCYTQVDSFHRNTFHLQHHFSLIRTARRPNFSSLQSRSQRRNTKVFHEVVVLLVFFLVRDLRDLCFVFDKNRGIFG